VRSFLGFTLPFPPDIFLEIRRKRLSVGKNRLRALFTKGGIICGGKITNLFLKLLVFFEDVFDEEKAASVAVSVLSEWNYTFRRCFPGPLSKGIGLVLTPEKLGAILPLP